MPGVAAAFDGKVAPVGHQGVDYLRDIGCSRWLDATCWSDFLLLCVPDSERIVVIGIVEGCRPEQMGQRGALCMILLIRLPSVLMDN